jgi:hypothetical protein
MSSSRVWLLLRLGELCELGRDQAYWNGHRGTQTVFNQIKIEPVEQVGQSLLHKTLKEGIVALKNLGSVLHIFNGE